VLISGSWDWPGLQSALVYEKGEYLDVTVLFFFLMNTGLRGSRKESHNRGPVHLSSLCCNRGIFIISEFEVIKGTVLQLLGELKEHRIERREADMGSPI